MKKAGFEAAGNSLAVKNKEQRMTNLQKLFLCKDKASFKGIEKQIGSHTVGQDVVQGLGSCYDVWKVHNIPVNETKQAHREFVLTLYKKQADASMLDGFSYAINKKELQKTTTQRKSEIELQADVDMSKAEFEQSLELLDESMEKTLAIGNLVWLWR